MAADPGEPGVRPEDHRDRVPADDPPDPELDLLVAREERLLLGADRVDVAGLGQRRQPDVELAGALRAACRRGTGRGSRPPARRAGRTTSSHSCGLGRVDVRELVLEFVEGTSVPRGLVTGPVGQAGSRRKCRRRGPPGSSIAVVALDRRCTCACTARVDPLDRVRVGGRDRRRRQRAGRRRGSRRRGSRVASRNQRPLGALVRSGRRPRRRRRRPRSSCGGPVRPGPGSRSRPPRRSPGGRDRPVEAHQPQRSRSRTRRRRSLGGTGRPTRGSLD